MLICFANIANNHHYVVKHARIDCKTTMESTKVSSLWNPSKGYRSVLLIKSKNTRTKINQILLGFIPDPNIQNPNDSLNKQVDATEEKATENW